MSAVYERRTLPFADCGLQLRSAGNKPPVLVGYPIVCNAMSESINGQFREIVHPDAVRSALARQPDVRALVDHEPSKILGRTKARTLNLTQDERGLRFECPLPNTSYAADVAESIKRGDVSGMSFGFDNKKDSWQDQVLNGKRTSVRTLHDIDLHDVSVVTFPAYPDASVALRSFERYRDQTMKPQDRILQSIAARIFGTEERRISTRDLAAAGGDTVSLAAQSQSATAHAMSAKAQDAADPSAHMAAADAHGRAQQAHWDASRHMQDLADYHRSIAQGHGAAADMHNAKAKGC